MFKVIMVTVLMGLSTVLVASAAASEDSVPVNSTRNAIFEPSDAVAVTETSTSKPFWVEVNEKQPPLHVALDTAAFNTFHFVNNSVVKPARIIVDPAVQVVNKTVLTPVKGFLVNQVLPVLRVGLAFLGL